MLANIRETIFSMEQETQYSWTPVQFVIANKIQFTCNYCSNKIKLRGLRNKVYYRSNQVIKISMRHFNMARNCCGILILQYFSKYFGF